MSPREQLKVLLFLTLFFSAVGFLLTLLSCGTEYWLLAAESCSSTEGRFRGSEARERTSSSQPPVRIFHEGLFWRCSFPASSADVSVWDLLISNQPSEKLCQAAFLFPFPVTERSWAELHGLPSEEYEHHSAIVFRTFWSIFLVSGSFCVFIGGFVVVCAGPLTNHRLYKVGGALQLTGGVCLLAVLLMFLLWIHVLDTLEQFVLHQRLSSSSSCPSFHLSVHHGPSFLLAPVSVFCCLLAGLLSSLLGRRTQEVQGGRRDKAAELPESDV